MPDDLPTEGVSSHVNRMRNILENFASELRAMQKLEAALKQAIERLDRTSNLVHDESRMIEQLIKREKTKPATLVPISEKPIGPGPVDKITDKVVADLELFMVETAKVIK